MPRAFLFDIGNVIVLFDFTVASQRFAALSSCGEEEVIRRLTPFKDDLESGRISDDDFIAQSIALLGFRGSRADFVQIWGDIFTENPPMLALIEKLAARHPLFLLSNTSGLHKEWLFGKFPVFRHFTGGIYSHEAQCMKPGAAIYQKAFDAFALVPGETLYIDDLAPNITAGEALGLVSHRYDPTQHAALESWLEGQGVAVV